VIVAEWETAEVPLEPSYPSPSGKTEIRVLPNLASGEITHATIGGRETSSPAYLDSLHEFFFVLTGSGQLWRSDGSISELVELRPNRCMSIPPAVNFQYQSNEEPMTFLVVVAPRWTADHWHEASEGLWDPVTGEAQAPITSSTSGCWATVDLPDVADHQAPNGSELRKLLACDLGDVAHVRLPANATTPPISHRTVDQVWYVLTGAGEVWRRRDATEDAVAIGAGTCLTIPVGTTFQCRNLGSPPLELLIGTFPRWPGPDEAALADGPWKPSSLLP
jgi:mannose-6-phosphate isomerase-like protein (cupin superfamily)